MKIIAILPLTLFFSSVVGAQQLCKDYITDEWPDSRYIVQSIDGDNVVTDKKTGLMWKQCTEGLSGTDCAIGTAFIEDWRSAMALAEVQNLSSFAGFTDWRTPNQRELRSLVVANCENPSINKNIFPNTALRDYWSSSPVAHDDFNSWTVNFKYGVSTNFGFRQDSSSPVRIVRSVGQ